MLQKEELEYLMEVLLDLGEQLESLTEQCHSMAIVTDGDVNKFFNVQETAVKRIDTEVYKMARQVKHNLHYFGEYGRMP